MHLSRVFLSNNMNFDVMNYFAKREVYLGYEQFLFMFQK
jgi:hypothetical protein